MTRWLLAALALAVAGVAAWLLLPEGDDQAVAPPANATASGPMHPATLPANPPSPAPATGATAPAPGAPPPSGPATAEEPPDDARTLDQSGRAQLAQGIEARRDGRATQARQLFEAAADALGRSIALTGERTDPWTLESMAQAQLELGNDADAIAWADRALQRLRADGGDNYETFRAASLTMNVGIVYYRAGQRQTGIAYMDQAISMAPTAFDRADFTDLKDETIGGAEPPQS